MASETGDPGISDEVSEEVVEEVVEDIQRPSYIYVRIPESMTNTIQRNGIIPEKKSIDPGYSTGVRGSTAHRRDIRTNTTDGSLIIHRGDPDPHPGTCQTFIHPPYDSKQRYRGEEDKDYHAGTLLSDLKVGAEECGFCFILYNGMYAQRELWIVGWAQMKWASEHLDLLQEDEIWAKKPWIEEFREEIEEEKELEEEAVRCDITFPRDGGCLSVCLVYVGLSEEASEEEDGEESEISSSAGSFILPRTDSERLRNPSFNEPGRTIAQLEFYTDAESPSPWAAFGTAPHINADVYSRECMKEINTWIEECISSHPACVENTWTTKPASDSGLPHRLLRLRDCHQDPPLVKLEDTSNTERYKYIALSHVWAFTEPYKTTRSNFLAHKDHIPWTNLSRPLQQAVAISLILGYEFLWIDSLCIIQDDRSDKEKELPRMSVIYGQAVIVFAVHGIDLGCEKVGLLGIKDKYHFDDPLVFCRLKIDHSNLFQGSKDPSSWLGRAWCMQEHIFAPRILHFGGGTEELFLECNTSIRCECGALEKDKNEEEMTLKRKITKAMMRAREDVDERIFYDELWKVYITACEHYTPRGVSFSTDTLSAVSSLMHRFVPHLGKYYAGLWERNLLLSLQWEASNTDLCHRHEEYVAPSFSWASRTGGVVWYMPMNDLPTQQTHHFAKVIDIECELADSDVCGRVKNGFITLRGYTTEMKIKSKLQWFPDGSLELTKEGFSTEICFVTLDSKEDLERVQEGMVVKCLDIMTDKKGSHGKYVSGLVLLPVGSEEGRYNRIGFSTMLDEHFKNAVVEEITIV